MCVTIISYISCYHSAGDSLISADPQYGKTHEVRLHDNIKLNCLASDEETPVRGARVSSQYFAYNINTKHMNN